MFKKMFALASITALTGLVASVAASGCSSTTSVNEEGGTTRQRGGRRQEAGRSGPRGRGRSRHLPDDRPDRRHDGGLEAAASAPRVVHREDDHGPRRLRRREQEDPVRGPQEADHRRDLRELPLREGRRQVGRVRREGGRHVPPQQLRRMRRGQERQGGLRQGLLAVRRLPGVACQDCADDAATSKCNTAAGKGACKDAAAAFVKECTDATAVTACDDLAKTYTFEAAARALCVGTGDGGDGGDGG